MDEEPSSKTDFFLAIALMILVETFVGWFLTYHLNIYPDSYLWWLIFGLTFSGFFPIIWAVSRISKKGDPSNLTSRKKK